MASYSAIDHANCHKSLTHVQVNEDVLLWCYVPI